MNESITIFDALVIFAIYGTGLYVGFNIGRKYKNKIDE